MNTHKSTLEALERLLYDKYIQTHEPLSPQGTASLDKLSPSESSLAEVLSSADVTGHIAKYQEFRETVRNGELGETGRFWLEYMDCIWLVLSLKNAIKTNDYDRSAISRMPDLFFCANQQNYARFLTYYGHFLEHIEKTHSGSDKLLRAGAISVARSQTPGNRCHTDKTIQETAVKWFKSKSSSGTYSAGIGGITSTYEASQCHILTRMPRESLWRQCGIWLIGQAAMQRGSKET